MDMDFTKPILSQLCFHGNPIQDFDGWKAGKERAMMDVYRVDIHGGKTEKKEEKGGKISKRRRKGVRAIK